MDTTQDRARAASLARTLTTSLTNPYSTSVPYPHHSPAHHANPQGYAYSSTYNPLAYSPSPTSYSSLGHPFSNTSSASASRNSHPRGASQTHWYTPGNSKCTHSGCTFTGSANSVQIHMMDRHLIYPPRGHNRKRQSDWDADPSLKGYVLVHTQSIENGSLAKLFVLRAWFIRAHTGNPFPSWARTYGSTRPKRSRRGLRSVNAAGRPPRASRRKSASWRRPRRMASSSPNTSC